MRKALLTGSASLIVAASQSWAQTPPPSIPDPETQNDIIVTGVRAALEKAIQVKRLADNHVEVISAEELGGLLAGAGLADVAVEPVALTIRFPSAEDFVRQWALSIAAVVPTGGGDPRRRRRSSDKTEPVGF